MIKTRIFKNCNYRAIYFNGKTIRITIDKDKPIKELKYPEFYDIKLTNRCNMKCSYCYQSSGNGEDYEAIEKLNNFFSNMNDKQRPFQIAYGGGEPTIHYQFLGVMRLTRGLGISPNYTTNGKFIFSKKANDIIEVTKKYCEGIAITCHEGQEESWVACANIMIQENIFTNFHILIHDKNSIDRFLSIYKKWKGEIKYFVLLPMVEKGRCKKVKKEYDYLFDKLKEMEDIDDIAFGAMFYPYLKDKRFLDLSLYEPEIFSKYLDLKDMKIYKSSFV